MSGLDVRTAWGATGLLADFNAAGLLSAADVHVATRLGRLGGEADERVLLAVALAVRAVRAGSVCIRLDDLDALAVPESEDAVPLDEVPWPSFAEWSAAVAASPLVGGAEPDDRPVRWVHERLYLDRYFRHEQVVRREVDRRLAEVEPVHPARVAATARRLFPEPADARQRLATAAAAFSRLVVLTGGPGTGKTTTVARVLAALQALVGPGLRVALAAPTGKAAARLQEAVRAQVLELDDDDQRRLGDLTASTVHRLLGWRPGSSTRFRHDADHHLPHDVVVVDETSMMSLPLMARLLEALRPDARLLLVGDPDQLASVEAGAVLGDLVYRRAGTPALREAVSEALPEDVAGGGAAVVAAAVPTEVRAEPPAQALGAGVVRLEVVHRHGAEIGALATAIRAGDAEQVLDRLTTGDGAVELVPVAGERPVAAELEGLRQDAVAAGVRLVEAARDGDVPGALRALEEHRLLLAHRRGPAGVARWSEQVQQWVRDAVPAAPDGSGLDGPWFPGRPLLVTTNDRDSGLYNGDTGVVVAVDGGVMGAFGAPDDPLLVRPHRLPSVESVYAMTVHRGQGSQFRAVTVLLPPASSPLLSRELFYTAVTRARSRVRVIGTPEAVRAAVTRPVRRASGLRDELS